MELNRLMTEDRSASLSVTRHRLVVPGLLAVLIAAAMAHGLLWSVVTPPLSGPDENAHAAYAQYLAETGSRPSDAAGGLSTQLAQFAWGIAASPIVGHPDGLIDWQAGPLVRSELARLPASAAKDGAGANAAASYPPLYYALTAVAYHLVPGDSIGVKLLAMRFVGVLLFAATVVLTWLLAGVVLAGLWPRFVAAALVAFQPKLGFMAGVVNPDNLLITLSSAFLLASALLICRGFSWWRLAAVVATTAAAAYTHPRGVFLILPLLFVLWFVAWRETAARGQPLIRKLAVAGGALLAAASLAVALSLITRWGNDSPVDDLKEFAVYIWQFYLPRLDFMQPFGPDYGYRQVFIETYFSTFGQIDVRPSLRFVEFIQAGAMVGLIALYTTAVARWRIVVASWPVVVLLAGTFVALLTLLHLVGYRDLQAGGDPIITGRYLLSCVAIYGLAAAWVLSSIPRRVGPFIAAPLLMISAMMSIGGIGVTALRFYG